MNHDHKHMHQEASQTSLSLAERVHDTFSQYGFMPHGHCYLWKPLLVSIHVVSDFLIGAAYVSISLILYGLVKKINLSFNRIVICFGLFIGACGMTHFIEIWNLWNADYWWAAWIKVITAIASVGTGIYLYKLRHVIVEVATAVKLAEERRLDLEALTIELEQRVKERTEEIQKALKARDEFLSVASHELKTPLTTLLIQAQMQKRLALKGDPKAYDAERIDAFAELTGKLANRLNRIVDDMLDISRLRSGQLGANKEQLDLCLVTQEVIRRMTPQFSQAGYAAPEFHGAHTIGLFDPQRIEQVLNNLLTNAIKYGEGKPIDVRVQNLGEVAQIIVHDQGIGVAKENQARIFDRFERAVNPNEISGLGLGLYISQQIVDAHEGRIWVESEVGKGSRFIVELPLKKGN